MPFTFLGCPPGTNAEYYNKENRINICPRLFECNYKLIDIQAIVFHEYIHVLQNQEGRYPAQYANGSFIKTTYTFRYGMEEVNAAWKGFYDQMDVAGIPRENRTEYQQRFWDQYILIMVDPVIKMQQNGETYTEERNCE